METEVSYNPAEDEISLGDIKIHYGTEGLLSKFSYEVGKLPEEAQHKINQALLSTAEWHKDQMRTTGPYIDHILMVALRVMVHFKIDDPDIIIAALLHDSVEDQRNKLVGKYNMPKEDVPIKDALAVIEEQYNPRVARIVQAVTNPRDGMSNEEYDAHIREVLIAEPDAIPVKLSDVVDNAVGIHWIEGKTEEDKRKKQVKSSEKYLPLMPFYEQIVSDDLYQFLPEVKARLMAQIYNAKLRMNDILKLERRRNAGSIGLGQL